MGQSNIGRVRGYRDMENKRFRKVTQLDEAGCCFFTIVLNEDGTFYKYSFDVEMEESAHYEFSREQEKELRALLREFRSWMKLEMILIEYLADHSADELVAVMEQLTVEK